MNRIGKTICISALGISLVTIFLGIALIFYSINEGNSKQSHDDEYTQIELVGKYSVNGSEFMDLSEDTFVDVDEINTVNFLGCFSSAIDKNENIIFRLTDLNFKLKVNGVQVVDYSDEYQYSQFMRSGGNIWFNLDSPGILSTDTIEIELTNQYKWVHSDAFVDFFREIYIGQSSELTVDILAQRVPNILEGALATFIGLLELVGALLIFLKFKIVNIGLCYNGGFAVFAGIWFFVHYDLLSLIFPYPAVIQNIDVVSGVSMTIFFTLYAGSLLHGARKAFLNLNTILASLSFLFLLALNIFGICDLMDNVMLILISILYLFLLSAGLIIIDYSKIKGKNQKVFMFSTIPLIIGGVIDVLGLISGYLSTTWATGVSFIFFIAWQMYYFLWEYIDNERQASRAKELENEMIQRKIEIMLSQIQPHFLYNSLTAISALCEIDPKKAQDATDNFSHYLRGNLESIANVNSIVFSKEIEHIENYVYLEKMRFGNRVNIAYDLKINDFSVPPLTIQPLVENAVKYGVSKKPEGGTVTISTWDDEKNIYVSVKDNGIGFDTSLEPDSSRQHIGISNVKTRLMTQFGGELKILSNPGDGTEALIKLPKNR